VDYLKQCFEEKERCVKLLTTKGNFLSTMSIRSEMTGIQVTVKAILRHRWLFVGEAPASLLSHHESRG